MIYRREIDGLRAVAVVPVILFHAGLTVFSGGYVGVDIFFVISGYLITSILIGELEQGNFSIARFYERRARRILPALFFVMLCCIPFAWMWMLPSELKGFSQSLVAVTLFASNMLFWGEENYFSPAAELKPLLHTWSLVVEEQYYVLFPVLLLLLWRFGRNRAFWAIAGMAAVSLLLSEWGWRHKPSANFYLAPTRAWELLAGSLCAFWLTGRAQRTNNWLSLLGLALIVFAIFRFDDATPFPSVYALVPVVGTALIILFGGAGTWAAELLGTRGFVGIGLISYSAYLWHQPLFAFARIRILPKPEQSLMLALAALSLVLAHFSWRYIEKPFRKGQASILPTRRAVFAASGIAIILFMAVGFVGHINNGFINRLDPEKQELLKTASFSPMRDRCHINGTREFAVSESCVYFGENPEIAVLGNSHAVEIAYSLAEVAKEYKKSVLHLTVSACLFLTNDENKPCDDFYSGRIEYILNKIAVKHVVLSFRYEISDRNSFGSIVDLANFLNSKGKNVVLILQAPALNEPATYYLRPYMESNYRSFFSRTRKSWVDEVADEHAQLSRLNPNIGVVDVADIFCDKVNCYSIKDGNLLYSDDNHMFVKGADLIAPSILKKIIGNEFAPKK